MHGLAIRSDASKYLCELLEPLPSSEHDEWIDKVVEAVQKLPINSTVISRDIILKAAQEVSANEDDDIDGLLQILDIYDTPKLTYSIERRKFILAPPLSRALHGDADDKAALFRDRYTTVYQRTCNHEFFRPPSIGSVDDAGNKKYTLQKVEFLLGLSSRENEVVVLGLLTQLTEGQYHLEDDTGAVTLNLKDTKFHTGLFVQNCFVLVEGWYEDGVLHALAMGLPPPEAPNTTRALLGNVNYFGGPETVCAKNVAKRQTAEKENQDAMLVFLSDLWLDKMKVLDKLRLLFAGYSQFPPIAFIFCGNFLSVSHGPQQSHEMKSAFNSLAEILSEFPELVQQSKFIFVPGPGDPGPSTIFPRPPLPKLVTEDFTKKVPSASFVSNPVRILYCTQEIVVFREDIVAKMCRNCVYFPTNSDDIPSHFAKTIVSQSSLSPLPLHVLPIYWGMDHCMALHPTPDLIVTADKGDPFITQDNNATVVNPGSFAKTDFSFKVYMPATRTVEDSQIGDAD